MDDEPAAGSDQAGGDPVPVGVEDKQARTMDELCALTAGIAITPVGRCGRLWDARPARAARTPRSPVYVGISHFTRMVEWSPETYGGKWVAAGEPALGARFKATTAEARPAGRTPPWSSSPIPAASSPSEATRCSAACETWRYRMAPDGDGAVAECYEVVEPDWAITNWLNGPMLDVQDRDDDLVPGLRTALNLYQADSRGSAPTPSRHRRSPENPRHRFTGNPSSLDRMGLRL